MAVDAAAEIVVVAETLEDADLARATGPPRGLLDDNEIDFAHALVGTKLAGQNAFVCGVRRKDCELFAVTYEDGEYKVTMIEKGVGPANLCVVNEKDRDIIVAANHTANEAAVYFVTE